MNPSSSNRKKKQWREEKERLLKMTLEERRKAYVRDVVPLKDIISWMEDLKSKCHGEGASEGSVKPTSELAEDNSVEGVPAKRSLSEKVSLYIGDITLLEIDAIVNAANSSLLGGGGVDGCIHRAAGPCLLAECRSLSGCETGEAKITCGYDLPAKYVIHTVGPMARGHINETHKEDLANCYRSSLRLAKENHIRSLAFPCISTGIYGFPNEPAAKIALDTIKDWLRENQSEMDRIIFCVFLDTDYKIYKRKLSEIFPLDEDVEEDTSEETASLNRKAQSPPSKKYRGKKSDNSENESDGENSTEEKEPAEEKETVEEKEWAGKEIPEEKAGKEKEIAEEKENTVEMEGQSQRADEDRPAPEVPPTADSIDSCQNKEVLRDSEEPQENLEDQSMYSQEQPEGHQDEEMKAEMKTVHDSQSSYMEIDDESSNHEEEADNEQYLLANEHQVEDSAEEKEKPSSEHSDSQEYVDAENDINLNSDAEMNSQLEPTQNPPQEQLIGEQDEKREQDAKKEQ